MSNYPIYDVNRYNSLNDVEKAYFNAHRESWYSFFEGLSIDELYLKMIEKSAFSLVATLNDYTKKIQQYLNELEERLNLRIDKTIDIHNEFVTTVNGELKSLKDVDTKYNQRIYTLENPASGNNNNNTTKK